MTTPTAKILANRANAAKSTGPVTAAGRATASRNALTHGLRAESPALLGCEDPLAWDELLESLREDHQPVGATEELLVEQVAAACWRRWRADAFENGTLKMEGAEENGLAAAPWRDAQKGQSLALILKYRKSAENAFTTALHELQRVQAARRGASVPPPAAVDISMVIEDRDGAE